MVILSVCGSGCGVDLRKVQWSWKDPKDHGKAPVYGIEVRLTGNSWKPFLKHCSVDEGSGILHTSATIRSAGGGPKLPERYALYWKYPRDPITERQMRERGARVIYAVGRKDIVEQDAPLREAQLNSKQNLAVNRVYGSTRQLGGSAKTGKGKRRHDVAPKAAKGAPLRKKMKHGAPTETPYQALLRRLQTPPSGDGRSQLQERREPRVRTHLRSRPTRWGKAPATDPDRLQAPSRRADRKRQDLLIDELINLRKKRARPQDGAKKRRKSTKRFKQSAA